MPLAVRNRSRDPARAAGRSACETGCGVANALKSDWPHAPRLIQRQLGHANLRVTTVYLQGIDSAEIIDAVHARMAPMMPASAVLGP